MRKLIYFVFILFFQSYLFAESWTENIEYQRAYIIVKNRITEVATETILQKASNISAKLADDFGKTSKYLTKQAYKSTNDTVKRGLHEQAIKYKTYQSNAKNYKVNFDKMKKPANVKNFLKKLALKNPIGMIFDLVFFTREINRQKKLLKSKYPNLDFSEVSLFANPSAWWDENGGQLMHKILNDVSYGATLINPISYDPMDLMPTTEYYQKKWLKDMASVYEANTSFYENEDPNIPSGMLVYLKILNDIEKNYGFRSQYNLAWVEDYDIDLITEKVIKTGNSQAPSFFEVASKKDFSDIPHGHIATYYIGKAIMQGIPIEGTTPNTFEPNENITNIQAFALTIYGFSKGDPIKQFGETFLINKQKYSENWEKAYTETLHVVELMPDIIKKNLYKDMTRNTMAKLLFKLFNVEIRNFLAKDINNNENLDEKINTKLNSLKSKAGNHNPRWPYEAYVLNKLGIVYGKNVCAQDTIKCNRKKFAGSDFITRTEFLIMLTNIVDYKYCGFKGCAPELIQNLK